MLEDKKILEIARQVAVANLSAQSVETVLTEAMLDSEGRDAVRITIVIKPGKIDKLVGDNVLDTLYQIQTRLSEEGEDRLALVDYATRKELDKIGASQL